jgi:hypothetical protein
VCFVWVLLAAAPAAAQEAAQEIGSPEDLGKYRFGPIRFTPMVTIANLGVDTNVFNETVNPKQDFTVTFGPKVDVYSRIGRGLVSGQVGVDYFYFQEYDTQRSFGTNEKLRIDYPLGRFTPFAEGRYVNTRQRQGYEIDARARRNEFAGLGGVDVRVGGRTVVRLGGAHEAYRFKSEDTLVGSSLSNELDRDTDVFGVAVRREMTPLTTFVVSAEQRWDRFINSPVRDADGIKVTPGFEFKPFALIDGKVFVGYRHFETLSPTVPDYSGPAASVDLGYTLRATRFTGTLNRDVTYSFDDIEPYYVQTDASLTVVQRVTTHWDVKGSVLRAALDYQAVTDSLVRTDHVQQYGAGGGYRLGDTVRFGVDVIHVTRDSVLPGRTYDGWRVGGSVDYGVKQR